MSVGTVVNDVIGFFSFGAFPGLGPGLGAAIDSLPFMDPFGRGRMQNMYDMAVETFMGRSTGPLMRMMGTGWAGAPWAMPFMMPSPMTMFPAMAPYAGAGYAGFGMGMGMMGMGMGGLQHMDLGFGTPDIPFANWLIPGRRHAMHFERMLRMNPYARASFEASVGGRVMNFGFRNEGKMTVARFPGAYHPMAYLSNPMAASGLAYMMNMQGSVMAHAGMYGGFGGMMGMMNPFMGMTAMGLYNAGGFGFPLPQGPAGPGWSPVDNSGPRGGWGFGSWNPQAMPGRINNTNPTYEHFHQMQSQMLLADPSLTIEDKVTLLLMLIMKKMDRDIERQAQYINSIQNQQSSRQPAGGKGSPGGKGTSGPFTQPGGGNNNPSIDVETIKLKRMIDKRSQMFDILRQIIDKYNETAKNMIQSIGR